AEPIRAHERLSSADVRARVVHLLELVGFRPDVARLFPHEFSGGQRQRLAIARALSTSARLIVLDEPVSALDVSIRAHIIDLLEQLQERLAVSYLFIAHDLAAVAHLSQRTAVMYLGKLVEVAESLELCARPLHPYTKALFAASLPSHPDEPREEIVLSGEVPSAVDPPRGCHFHPRCPFVMSRCAEYEPPLVELSAGHKVTSTEPPGVPFACADHRARGHGRFLRLGRGAPQSGAPRQARRRRRRPEGGPGPRRRRGRQLRRAALRHPRGDAHLAGVEAGAG